jgi:hypothetical protein
LYKDYNTKWVNAQKSRQIMVLHLTFFLNLSIYKNIILEFYKSSF